MKSRTTAQFRKMFADLPQQVQQQARAVYRQFQQDSSYPSLRFKKVHPELPNFLRSHQQELPSSWSSRRRHGDLVLDRFARRL